MSVRVYVISESKRGPVKVGISANPVARLNDLQGCNPRRLRLQYTSRPFERTEAMRIERLAHDLLSEHRLRGEWFRCWVGEAVGRVRTAGGMHG